MYEISTKLSFVPIKAIISGSDLHVLHQFLDVGKLFAKLSTLNIDSDICVYRSEGRIKLSVQSKLFLQPCQFSILIRLVNCLNHNFYCVLIIISWNLNVDYFDSHAKIMTRKCCPTGYFQVKGYHIKGYKLFLNSPPLFYISLPGPLPHFIFFRRTPV